MRLRWGVLLWVDVSVVWSFFSSEPRICRRSAWTLSARASAYARKILLQLLARADRAVREWRRCGGSLLAFRAFVVTAVGHDAGPLPGGAGSAPVTVVPSLAGNVTVRVALAAALPGTAAGPLPGGAGSAPVTVVPSLAGSVTVVVAWPPLPVTATATPPPTSKATTIVIDIKSRRGFTNGFMIAAAYG